jgi:hypothetical protein
MKNKIVKDEIFRECSRHGRERNLYNILVGEIDGKRQMKRHRWNYDINIGFKEIGWEGVDSIHLAECTDQWVTVVDMAVNPRVANHAVNSFSSCV